MAANPKMLFDFDKGSLNEEKRKARALEYIAHYLDRIDGHLERIATGLGTEFEKDTKLLALLSQIAGSTSRRS